MGRRGGAGRRTAAAGGVLAAVLSAGTAAHAAPAGERGPVLLAVTPVVRADEPTWITGRWLARSAVCGFRLTASGDHTQVLYPSNTGTYTSFYRGDRLGRLRSDFTALRVTAGGDARNVVRRLRLSYVVPGLAHRDGDRCTGAAVDRTLSARLTVLNPLISD